MQVEFRASERSTLGIEIELAIVDLETGALCPAASQVLDDVGPGYSGGEHPRIKHELFESTLEIVTGVCGSVEEARTDLAAGVSQALDSLEPRGMGLIGLGLHPFSAWYDQEISPGERYAELIERIRWPVRRLMTQGVHFHVGVGTPEKAVAITNALTAYLPHFLALSASSPFWHGHDTGLASARTKVFEALPTTGVPPLLDGWADLETFLGSLMRAGSITTIREVWWDVRPHPDFGTVELRMCDAMPTLREVCALAALAQSLVDRMDRLLDAGSALPRPREWLVRENKWRAARYGVDADIVVTTDGDTRPLRAEVAGLVDDLAPVAARLGCADELEDVRGILGHGPSYLRQRAVVAGGGTLSDVVHHARRELLSDRPGV